jgi:hypothetical protein
VTAVSFFIAGTSLVWSPEHPHYAGRAGDRAQIKSGKHVMRTVPLALPALSQSALRKDASPMM